MFTISREYEFCAAHRLEGHPKCGRLHGHNYRVQVEIRAGDIQNSMLMDYADLDKLVKPVIEELDHRYIVSYENLNSGDPYAEAAATLGHSVMLPVQRSTAEALSMYLAGEVGFRLLDLDFDGLAVIIWETPKSVARFDCTAEQLRSRDYDPE